MTRGPERDYLEGSRIVAAVRKIASAAAGRWNAAWGRTLSSPGAGAWRKAWFESPLRWLGVAVVSAVLANMLALWLLRKETGAGAVALRALFLLAGLAMMGCRGNWDSVREGSFFLRALFPRRER